MPPFFLQASLAQPLASSFLDGGMPEVKHRAVATSALRAAKTTIASALENFMVAGIVESGSVMGCEVSGVVFG